MIEMAGDSFGFGWQTGRICRLDHSVAFPVTGVPIGSILVLTAQPNAKSLATLLREIRPAVLILPGCSAYSHLGAAVWSSKVPALSLTSVDGLHTGRYAAADFEKGVLLVAETASEESALRSSPVAVDAATRPRLSPSPNPLPVAIFAEISAGDDPAEAFQAGADRISIIKAEQFLAGSSSDTDKLVSWASSLRPPHRLLLRFFDPALDPYTHRECESAHLGYRGVRSVEIDSNYFIRFRHLLEKLSAVPTTIVLPMVSSLAEVQRFRALIRDMNATLGITVETPAAALQINSLLTEVDFVEIGLNDLTQYTMAWDRDVPHAERLPPRHIPEPVQQLIQMVTGACMRASATCILGLDLKPSPYLAKLLRSLGVQSISCAPALVPRWRRLFDE